MTEAQALAALSALAQPMRLHVFRLLVQAGPDGLPAGDIATRLGVLQNSLSSNLSRLTEAGLITRTRAGRMIVYAARMEGMGALIDYLMQDCCGGDPAACTPLTSKVSC